MNKLIRKFKIWKDKSKGENYELLSNKALYGKFYVVYDDGKKSSVVDYYTAKEYTLIFDGTIHHIKYGRVE